MATISLKDQILQSDDLPREKVYVPEWNLDVWIRCLTAAERDDYELSMLEPVGQGRDRRLNPNLANAKAKLVARALIDESGQRIFTDAGALELGGKSASAINRLYDIARRLSGISEADEAEILKNSENGQDASLPSD